MIQCTHGEGVSTVIRAARDYVTGDTFQVVRCNRCELLLTSPRPTAGDLPRYYPPAYYGAAGERRYRGPIEAAQRLLYASRARAVERFAGRTGRVLDVGCGPGLQLEAFRRRGWDPVGVELSEQSAARARAARLTVHVGELDAWPWPDGSFDAIVMWHVLEHWPEPALVIARAARLLRTGGVLMVGVPNAGSLEARLAQGRWFHLDVPRHLVHLTRGWLLRAVSESALAPVLVSYRACEYDAFSFVQSALNCAGLRHNHLYDLLRARGSRLLADHAAWHTLATVVLAIPLAAASVPVTSALGLLRQGSSLTMYAVKR